LQVYIFINQPLLALCHKQEARATSRPRGGTYVRRYETIFIVKSNVGEEDLTGIIDKTSSIITNDGGTILKIDKWGIKKLAYLIKKESQGNYVYMDYAGIPATVAEIERIFKIDDRLLKFMTVKLADSCDPAAILEEIATKAAEAAVESSEEEEMDDAQPEEAAAEESE
jgi:small subunit ribosomal protein S6